jgi:hypothetical protein
MSTQEVATEKPVKEQIPPKPRKEWPPPFETGGLSFVYDATTGFYYDADSMFFFYPPMKLYYSSYSGQYYSYAPTSSSPLSTFVLFDPPKPAPGDASLPPTEAISIPMAAKSTNVLTTMKETKIKKDTSISFGMKVRRAYIPVQPAHGMVF